MDSHTEYDRVAAAECGLRRRVSVAASLLVCDCEDRQVLEKETEERHPTHEDRRISQSDTEGKPSRALDGFDPGANPCTVCAHRRFPLEHDLGVEYRVRADTARDGLVVW